MTIGTCQGPNGEPGLQARFQGQQSECFIYDPDQLMTRVAAQTKAYDAQVALESAGAAGAAPPVPGPVPASAPIVGPPA